MVSETRVLESFVYLHLLNEQVEFTLVQLLEPHPQSVGANQGDSVKVDAVGAEEF